MTRFTPALCLLLGACAAAAGEGTVAPSTETIAIGRVGARIAHDQVPNAHVSVPLPATRVAQQLPAVYAALGIPVAGQDARSVSSGQFTARARLGGRRPSASLSCGAQQGVENADSYEVTVLVRTTITADGATATTVESVVQASARPRGTGGSNPVTCSSTGALEGAIVAALTQGAAAGG